MKKQTVKDILLTIWIVAALVTFFAAFALAEPRWALWLQMARSGNYYKAKTFATEAACQTALDDWKARSDKDTPGRYRFACYTADTNPCKDQKVKCYR